VSLNGGDPVETAVAICVHVRPQPLSVGATDSPDVAIASTAANTSLLAVGEMEAVV